MRLPGRVLLAPMEGITDPLFRSRLAALGGLAATVTEFIRISVAPVPRRVVARSLGPGDGVPCAAQLMAAGPERVEATAANAEAAGAAWIDLNFGCPAPVVFGKCAGSALLAHPGVMAAIVRAAIAGTRLPVTAKLRVGITGPEPLAANLLALAEAGAAAITLHGRLRVQGYGHPATWAWIAEAVAVLRRAGHRIPVIGNGGVDQPEQVDAMRAGTGCDGVMVGRAALADPFLFRVAAGGARADAAEAAAFALAYHDGATAGRGAGVALAKLKQMIRWYRAGGIFAGCEDQRGALLRAGDAAPIRAWLVQRAAAAAATVTA